MSIESKSSRKGRPSEMSTVDRVPISGPNEDNSYQAQEMLPANAGMDFVTGDYGPAKQGFTHYHFEHETIGNIDAKTQKMIYTKNSVLQIAVLIALVFLCTFLMMQALLYWHPEFLDPDLKVLVKRSETGAVIGGVVGGTVVLLIILSICFIQMCR